MEKPLLNPKYHIGQTLFFVENNEVVSKVCTGIFTEFDFEGSYSDEKKKTKFDGYMYFFGIHKSPYQYDWVDENRLFISKEELLESL